MSYIYCAGLNAVMLFIAKTGETDAETLWLKLAQAIAVEYGQKAPRTAHPMGCQWLLRKMEAVTAESQFYILRKVEPLFHGAWETSEDAVSMIRCAEYLYPHREEPMLRKGESVVNNDEVRLAVCDIVETVLRYASDDVPAYAIDTARRYALGETSYNNLVIAHQKIYRKAQASMTLDAAENVDWAASSATTNRVGKNSVDDVLAVFSEPSLYRRANAGYADLIRKRLGTPGLMLLAR